ncbi:X-box-binding protein 1 [Caenorhabditis elegans]|uniref:X-box-binding protein 1 n=1 Tax=Caenorhabditis elegans TaxID=6239 RepID=XBP1_CAEEL|nr:X-box-binding protein 1 [Caenorhabditis elegans]G5EE07.1 RecName: Full=X-box-binding protein 1 [Caenorhabditis elegans]AAL60200.1 X-box binding protein unprocessed isoform [Caenorhabditis elegans]CAL63999.1 X-box-binding protein 1 [Caenorhabditis elegans]|eukprot:NP_001076646.1 X-box Binding Protein homolog [Caenorhabditis elegans]
MSNYPKRIYVLPARHVAAPQPQRMAPKRALPTEQVVAQLLGDDMGPSGPRKRERLNHLSQEEKMDRRKLKNRVAAQNARDKKKERSAKIEDVMRDLVEENRRLRAENERLRRQNKNLMNQQNESVMYMEENNENLMNSNDACIYQNVVYEEEVVGEVAPVVVVGGEDRRAFESAAFINEPQQWEQARSTSINNNISNQLRRMDSKKNNTISVDMYLTIISILCNHMDRNKKMDTSNKSSNISRAQAESSIDSLLATLRKEQTVMQRLVQADPCTHLQKRVKHFRRIP